MARHTELQGELSDRGELAGGKGGGFSEPDRARAFTIAEWQAGAWQRLLTSTSSGQQAVTRSGDSRCRDTKRELRLSYIGPAIKEAVTMQIADAIRTRSLSKARMAITLNTK